MNPAVCCYFDNNATTRVAPEAVEVMLPFLAEHWGNPSSAYRLGRTAARGIELAREKLAALIQAEPEQLVFTSCGTESNNAAIHSALRDQPEKRHLVMSAVEHPANLSAAAYWGRLGYETTFVPVDGDGRLDLDRLSQAIRPDTALVSIMWANNETGVIFPVAEIGALCRDRGVLFHTDAVQVPGKVEIDVGAVGADFLSFSGHKLYAPKGVGLLYLRHPSRFQPYLLGGNQERGRRAGTENVAGVVGFGRAAELASRWVDETNRRVRAMRDRLENGILATIPGTFRNGGLEPRLPNTANLGFAGVEAEAVLLALDRVGIFVSSGSACSTGSLEPSHVLTAMGLAPDRAKGCLRFSLGIYTTEGEVEYVLEQLPEVIGRLRAMSPREWR